MNIKQAKEQIENAMKAYLTKDEYGNYLIPVEKQRPVFLMGPPGIGKTAIMEEISQETGVGLVTYSMTHHTRQSALGLPFIEKKVYNGKEYSISEYTMSEIIASIYEMMENTGVKEGILFLDEINCVSETLAPAMLQFLQYKIFGRYKVPAGWIIATAGNPPEYNNSVREFDIATWDRLKRIDVEPDLKSWKEYAVKKEVHPAVLTYLEIKYDKFYSISKTVDGKNFVTARGWSDLSDMMKLYEKNNIPVDKNLIIQYIQDRVIANDFSIYFDMFRKYRSEYEIDKILAGEIPDSITEKFSKAEFDEFITLIRLLLDGLSIEFHNSYIYEKAVLFLLDSLKRIKKELASQSANDAGKLINSELESISYSINKRKLANSISSDEEKAYRKAVAMLEKILKIILESKPDNPNDTFSIIKRTYESFVSDMKNGAYETGKKLTNAFNFMEKMPGNKGILVFVTELTVNFYSSMFISRNGCDKYFEHNKNLMFDERHQEIMSKIASFEL